MKKIKSKKAVIGVVAALAAVSVSAVGFSSWVIGASQQTDTVSQISVTTAAVTDNRFTLKAALNSSDPSIRFDANTSDTSGTIKYGSEASGGEDLTFAIDLTLTANTSDSNDTLGNATVAVAFSSETLSDWVGKNYITTPVAFSGTTSLGTPTSVATVTNITIPTWTTAVDSPRQYTNTITFKFGWGTAFGGVNPSSISSVTDDHITALKAIANQSISLNVTVTATPAA